MSCDVTDITCQIEAAAAPYVMSVALLVVLFFIGMFGGRTGKIFAVIGVILLFLWWFGFPQIGLEPLRRYMGYTVALIVVAGPDPFELYLRGWQTRRGGG